MYVSWLEKHGTTASDTASRKATEDSILAIQIFDQKKFKKKDQGFLGVINVRVGDVIDLDIGGDGCFPSLIHRDTYILTILLHRDADERFEKVYGQSRRPRQTYRQPLHKPRRPTCQPK
jgi:hypothetical protein